MKWFFFFLGRGRNVRVDFCRWYSWVKDLGGGRSFGKGVGDVIVWVR